MKGLLSRLVARASGTTVAVRSDARLALGAPAPVHSAPDVRGPSLAFETREGVPGVPAPATVRSDLAFDQLPSPIASAARGPQTGVESEPQLDRTSPNQPEGPASVAAIVNVPLSPPPRLVDYAVDRGDVKLPGRQVTFGATDRSADSRQDEVVHATNTVRVVRDPPILMPLAAAARPSAPPPMTPVITRTPGGAAAHFGQPEERDVHIHIGCVEVTAVHEAVAPPRRRLVSTPPPMSLDAYLAKRARG